MAGEKLSQKASDSKQFSMSMEEVDDLFAKLNPEKQGEVIEAFIQLVKDALTKQAIAEQDALWEARLDEQLARAARGENPIHHSEEEFFAALDAPSSEDGE